MIDPKILDEIAKNLDSVLPSSARDLRDDIQRNIRSVVQASFERMDLVTREEFDVQVAVLERTREQLKALEARVAQIEEQKDTSLDKP